MIASMMLAMYQPRIVTAQPGFADGHPAAALAETVRADLESNAKLSRLRRAAMAASIERHIRDSEPIPPGIFVTVVIVGPCCGIAGHPDRLTAATEATKLAFRSLAGLQ
jgi:hypothetical protein